MKVIEKKDGIVITGLEHFHPVHTFECGQAFRWDWDGIGYTGIVRDKVLRIVYNDGLLEMENCSIEDFFSIWKDYFDIDRDYAGIKECLSSDPVLALAVEHGWGIRILNQDPWETLISFIISSNNGISRIKRIISNICVRYGERINTVRGCYYTFPQPELLANADEGDLRKCGCGYRAPYIKKTASLVAGGAVNLQQLKDATYDEAFKVLVTCAGVGPKVADCILLFSLGKGEAFPVDVWIKRIMEELYFHQPVPINKVKEYARERFGSLAGYAQQYLFYYAREKKIGKQ